MNIQLDTKNKTVTLLSEDVALGNFIETMKALLPGGAWKEFKLIPELVKQWTNPFIIYPTVPMITPLPSYPWITWMDEPTAKNPLEETYIVGVDPYQLTGDTYNIDIKE